MLVLVAVVTACNERPKATDDPWAQVPIPAAHTDHASLIQGPFADAFAVTRRCLECHPDAAREMQETSHWTWISDQVEVAGREKPLPIGKRNMINNFCISVEGNWPRCTSCHAGYGWQDDSFDFTSEEAVDCLVCHDQSGGYVKAPAGAGMPAPGVDLVQVAKSVGRPTRTNCGACHFSGGGGDAVKHGDMDATMKFPSPRIDVHMGKHGFECVDCHRTENHQIGGKLPGMSSAIDLCIWCIDCHSEQPHADERINTHLPEVSCQACHIPYYAIEAETKMSWDWSTAGLENAPDERRYSKNKGSFEFARQVVPVYQWCNGTVDRYLPGQTFDPDKELHLSCPRGDVTAADAQIWPFKVHKGRQVYDVQYKYLLKPKLYGPGGYWEDFDWDLALRLGAESSGLPYSGEYAFADTAMCWPITHMVQPKERALQCTDCHGHADRLDWQALGYSGDPADRGTREQLDLLRNSGATN